MRKAAAFSILLLLALIGLVYWLGSSLRDSAPPPAPAPAPQTPPPVVEPPRDVPLPAPTPAAPGPEPQVAPEPAAGGPLEAVRQALHELKETPEMASGTMGFYLARLEAAGEPLLVHQAQQSFITASTMKVVTTGTALYRLGAHHRFATVLVHEPGPGNLRIIGSGDPSLGRGGWDGLFEKWHGQLRAAGISSLPGRIIADESAWETQEIPGSWPWADIGNYYAPPLSPLAFHDNEFHIRFRLGAAAGEPARFLEAEPWPAGLEFFNEMMTGPPGSGDNGYVYGGPRDSLYILRGTLPLDGETFRIRAAFPDSALFCAQQLTAELRRRGMAVGGEATTSRRLAIAAGAVGPDGPRASPPAAAGAEAETAGPPRVVARHESPPLHELLVPINHRSLNLDCECLLRTMGGGDAARGLEDIRKFFRESGIPLAGYQQHDGSGLSRLNMITPESLARALAVFATGAWGEEFRRSLPGAGRSGTLQKVAAGGLAVGRIRAKSGHIERVKCYTGLVEGGAGGDFVFAIMLNNPDASSTSGLRGGIDRLFAALAGL